MVTKPLPTGRQAFRLPATVTYEELKDDNRSLLMTIRALHLSYQTQLILETFSAKVAQSPVLSCLLYGTGRASLP
jgi:hypothetical protein